MNFEDAENWHTTELEQEPYSGRVDRFLIFVGDRVTRYAFVLLFFVILGVMGLSMAAGGLLLAQQVGERFNELDAREHERQALLEQQLEQTTNVIELSTQKRVKVIDESEWFVVIDQDEPDVAAVADEDRAPASSTISDIEPDAEVGDIDGSQQYVEPAFEPPASLDEIQDFFDDEVTTSN